MLSTNAMGIRYEQVGKTILESPEVLDCISYYVGNSSFYLITHTRTIRELAKTSTVVANLFFSFFSGNLTFILSKQRKYFDKYIRRCMTPTLSKHMVFMVCKRIKDTLIKGLKQGKDTSE